MLGQPSIAFERKRLRDDTLNDSLALVKVSLPRMLLKSKADSSRLSWDCER